MPFCTLFAGLSSTNKSSISLLLLSHSRSVLATLSFSPSFLFTLISGRNCFLSSPVLSDYNGSPDTRFSRATNRLMSWPDGERYLFPLQSLVVFSSDLSYPLSSFLGLEAYCLIEILRHLGSLDFHRGTCASTSCSLYSLSPSLQRTQSSVKLLSF